MSYNPGGRFGGADDDGGTDRSDRGTGRGGTSPDGPAGVDDPDPSPPEDDNDPNPGGRFGPPEDDDPPSDPNPGGRFGDTDPAPEPEPDPTRTITERTDISVGAGSPGGIDAPDISGTTPVEEVGRTSLGIEPTSGDVSGTEDASVGDRIGGGIDRVQSVGAGVQNELQETFPGRTGEVAALGAGIAAVPEPTPATEITGGAIVGGAALAGGAILASQAARNSELEVGDFTPNELEPSGRTRQEIREQEVAGSAGIGNNELQPTGGSVAVSELDVGATQQRPELEVGGSTGAGGTANQPADDTVVPGEFPLPGRDIPRDPTQEAGDEPSPGDVVGGADFATGVTIGSGTGSGTGREVNPGRTGTGTGTASEILDEVRRDINNSVDRGPGGAFRPERDFPTGAGAVVGRAVDRAEQVQQPDLDEIGVGAGVGVAGSGVPTDPLAPPAEDQRPDTPADIGGEIGQAPDAGLGTDTGTDTPVGSDTGTAIANRVNATTAVESATALENVLATQQQTMVENQPALENATAQETALEQALAQPTLAGFGVATGGTPTNELDEDERFPFDDDSGDSDPLALLASRDDAVFGSGITGGGEALGELFDSGR